MKSPLQESVRIRPRPGGEPRVCRARFYCAAICSAIICLFVASMQRTGASPATQPQMKISIAMRETNDPKSKYSLTGESKIIFFAVIENTGSDSVKLWNDWNSWGYDNLSFEIIDNSGKTSIARRKKAAFTRNFPAVIEIGPGEVIVREVDLLSKTIPWTGFPLPRKAERSKPFQMRALYSIKDSKESKELGVWTGAIRSQSHTFTIEQLR
jgi:hypothetical protein